MKAFKIFLFTAVISAIAVTLPSCKAKKLVAKPAPVAENTAPPVEKKTAATAPAPTKTETPAPEKPNFNFTNIQFEFNSAILKTAAIENLDAVASEMKKFPSSKFILNGYASQEGTAAHNMALSIDRANSVKTYLSNSGVSESNLTTKGYGESNPVASNSTEKGRELNRRVEVKLSK